jgi:chemotaxis protein histidine kinase CheA
MRPETAGVPDTAWTVDALRSVWERQQKRVGDRIYVIERATEALAKDRLDPGLKRDAERAAHMLAGSIGMFGFLEASEAARALERELERPTQDRAPALAALLLRVRRGVAGPLAL